MSSGQLEPKLARLKPEKVAVYILPQSPKVGTA